MLGSLWYVFCNFFSLIANKANFVMSHYHWDVKNDWINAFLFLTQWRSWHEYTLHEHFKMDTPTESHHWWSVEGVDRQRSNCWVSFSIFRCGSKIQSENRNFKFILCRYTEIYKKNQAYLTFATIKARKSFS